MYEKHYEYCHQWKAAHWKAWRTSAFWRDESCGGLYKHLAKMFERILLTFIFVMEQSSENKLFWQILTNSTYHFSKHLRKNIQVPHYCSDFLLLYTYKYVYSIHIYILGRMSILYFWYCAWFYNVWDIIFILAWYWRLKV